VWDGVKMKMRMTTKKMKNFGVPLVLIFTLHGSHYEGTDQG
jgi:hypothetical protein